MANAASTGTGSVGTGAGGSVGGTDVVLCAETGNNPAGGVPAAVAVLVTIPALASASVTV